MFDRQRSIGQFIPDLHHRRPDVVEKLNFHHRLQPARGHADRAAHDAGLRQRGVIAARAAKLPLQAMGDFEDPALAFHLGQIAFMAAVGNVLTENHDARIASHLILQADIDEIHHRLGLAVKLRRMIKVFGSGIHGGGVNVLKNGFRRDRLGRQGQVGRLANFMLNGRLDFLQLLFRNPLFLRQEPGETRYGVALRLLLTHFLRLIKPLVVGKRMRIRAHHVGVNQRRSFALPYVFNRLACRLVTLGKIRAVAFERQQMGKTPDQAGNFAPRSLHVNGHGDGVAVVLHHVKDGKLSAASVIQRLPEFTFARSAIAQGDVSNLVIVKTGSEFRRFLNVREIPACFRGAHRVQDARSRGARAGNDVQFLRSPMRRHLPAAAGRVVLRSHGSEQHLVRRRADLKTKCPVAVVGIKPVIARLEVEGHRHTNAFVPHPVDLKESAILSLELDLFVIHAPRRVHGSVGAQKQLLGKRCGFQDMIRGRGHRPSQKAI